LTVILFGIIVVQQRRIRQLSKNIEIDL
jgi:hypothetical protein